MLLEEFIAVPRDALQPGVRLWQNRLPNRDSCHIRHTGYKLDTPS